MIAGVLATAVLVALAYSLLALPSYRAESRFLVKLGKEKLSAVNSLAGANYNVVFQERSQNVHNELEILRSLRVTDETMQEIETSHRRLMATPQTGITAIRWMLADAIQGARDLVLEPLRDLGIARRYTPRERLIAELQDALDFEVIEDTDMIEVGFSWRDPEFAANTLNLITRAYLRNHIEAHETQGSQAFYVDQIALYERQLEELEERMAGFLTGGEIANMEVQKEVLLTEISELETLHTEATISERSARLKAERVRDMYARSETWVETPDIDDEVSDLRALDNSYFALKTERDRLLDTFVPESREIQRLDTQMQSLRDQKSQSLLDALGVLEQVHARERRTLEAKIAEKQTELEELIAATLPLAVLERERAITEKTYLLYKEKAEELRISDDLNRRQITSISVVREATPPRRESWPKRKLIVGLAGLIGLLIGLGHSFLAEVLNHTFRDPEDVAAVLKLPVLATVPDVPEPESSRQKEMSFG
jgi:uncharacterized protein involved in exopolysaccharide biosynthesis